MCSCCGSDAFLCGMAFDQHGIDGLAARREDFPRPRQYLPPALLRQTNHRLSRLTELRNFHRQLLGDTIVWRPNDVHAGNFRPYAALTSISTSGKEASSATRTTPILKRPSPVSAEIRTPSLTSLVPATAITAALAQTASIRLSRSPSLYFYSELGTLR